MFMFMLHSIARGAAQARTVLDLDPDLHLTLYSAVHTFEKLNGASSLHQNVCVFSDTVQ